VLGDAEGLKRVADSVAVTIVVIPPNTSSGSPVLNPPPDLSALMRTANAGDAMAYRRVLEGLASWLRPIVKRGLYRAGRGPEDVEDIVQETLLAVHLKRHTWDSREPLEPWVRAIAHHKLVDMLRRRGFHQHLPIDDYFHQLAAVPDASAVAATTDMLSILSPSARQIVEGMSLEGCSAREVGNRLGMSEVAVRVALHRALRRLAAAYRKGEA
jgi:RNA polymerase sigma-70 factor (ECF subfamily)